MRALQFLNLLSLETGIVSRVISFENELFRTRFQPHKSFEAYPSQRTAKKPFLGFLFMWVLERHDPGVPF